MLSVHVWLSLSTCQCTGCVSVRRDESARLTSLDGMLPHLPPVDLITCRCTPRIGFSRHTSSTQAATLRAATGCAGSATMRMTARWECKLHKSSFVFLFSHLPLTSTGHCLAARCRAVVQASATQMVHSQALRDIDPSSPAEGSHSAHPYPSSPVCSWRWLPG
jgi:hypothetical protein